jgi:hypothetical protein
VRCALRTPPGHDRRAPDRPRKHGGHLRLLAWLDEHPTDSLAAAAQALDLAIIEVEVLCADLVDAEMIERALPLFGAP